MSLSPEIIQEITSAGMNADAVVTALALRSREMMLQVPEMLEVAEQAKEAAAKPVATAPVAEPVPFVALVPQPDVNGEFARPVDGAIYMAAFGIPQTPLNGKAAFLKEWQNSATTDARQILAWGEQFPGCNFGSVAKQGEFSVFEMDTPPADTPNAIERFKQQGGTFTAKLTVRSRPGRGHCWYKSAPGVENVSQAYTKHGDFSVRANNEYCVSPGSFHPDTKKQYTVLLSGAPETPAQNEIAFWESEKVSKDAKSKGEAERNTHELIPHGKIHGHMLTWAGRLRNDGLTPEEIEPILIRMVEENCEPPIDIEKVKAVARSMANYEERRSTDVVLTQIASVSDVPIVDDPTENDPRFEMTGDKFNTNVYEEIAKRSTTYPNPGERDLISIVAKKRVAGTSIPLAYVREPIKAIVLHALDGKLIHPAHRKLSLRGNYFNLGETEAGKTKGLDWALETAAVLLKNSDIHADSLFRYKSEQVFLRSFTPEGTTRKNGKGEITGHHGHSSQFLHSKEGNLIARCSDYFATVFAQLTNLYNQTERRHGINKRRKFQRQEYPSVNRDVLHAGRFSNSFRRQRNYRRRRFESLGDCESSRRPLVRRQRLETVRRRRNPTSRRRTRQARFRDSVR